MTSLIFGVFVWLFLYLFRPFGLHFLSPDEAPLLIAGYGLVTIVVMLFNFFVIQRLFPGLFTEEKWTISSQFLYTLWMVLTVGIGNAFYTAYVFARTINFSSLVYFQVVTLMVAVIPVSFMILINQNRLLRRNTKKAEDLTGRIRRYKKMEQTEKRPAILKGENADEKLKVEAASIYYLLAADNYIEVVYRENDQVQRKLLRTTLKSARQQLHEHTSFYRCHRSWIVNLDHVKSVKGNAQGYRLVLDSINVEIPVSRTLNGELDSRLAK